MNEDTDNFQPPSSPPPLLTQQEIDFICHQGWLPVLLPQHLEEELQYVTAEASTFFQQDAETKAALYPARNLTECGYYVVPEEKEYITMRHRLHTDSQLESHVQIAWQQAASFLHRILCDLSRAFGVELSALDPLVQDGLNLPVDDRDLATNISLMRLFRYYPQGVADQHTDVGLLTLCVGGAEGLQVVNHSGDRKTWLTTKWPVVLIGEVASALLNGKVRAGIHRVVENAEGRDSFVFAMRPCLKGTLNLSDFGGEGVVDTKEYFYRIKNRKYNINATREVRAKQRREREGERGKTEQSETPVESYG